MLNKLYEIKFLGHSSQYRDLVEITVYGRGVEDNDIFIVLAAWDLPKDEDDRSSNWEIFPILKTSIKKIQEIKYSRSKKIETFMNQLVSIEFLDHVKDAKTAVLIEAFGKLISESEESYTIVSLDFDEKYQDRENNWVIFTILKPTIKSLKKLIERKPRKKKEVQSDRF